MKINRLVSLLLLTASFGAAADEVKIEFFTPDVVRVLKTPGDAADRVSMVVTASPEKVKVSESRSGDNTVYRSSALTVTVGKDGRVDFATASGQPLMSEGAHSFTPISAGPDAGAYKVSQHFAIPADEPLYGIGMMQHGKMNLRGHSVKMQQSNLEDFAHVFQSVRGYGIYWDNYSPTEYRGGADVELESQVGDAVDYYFMYGGNADGVVSRVRHLTGKVPMMPLWSYGFHQSRERYKTQDELLEVVSRYRKDGVPLDGIIQDWQYWGSNYTWNAMEFINDDFDRAQAMIDSVHAWGAHITISVWSSFGPHTKQYRELKEKGLLFSFDTWPESGLNPWPPRRDYPSGVRVFDCYSPEARDIYWKHLTRLHDMGIDGWWLDSTDPDHVNYKESDLDEVCSAGSFRKVRNLFPFMVVGGVDSHQRAADSTKRVFILTRSYFAGQQRYGAHSWSGDVGSNWNSFRAQVPLCLNHTMTGNPNVNTDIGGFFAGAYNGHGMRAYDNPNFRELYVRWMQFGLFSPMMRSHGTDVPRELYFYGKAGEPVYDALVSAVRTRYNMLPYMYSLSRRVSEDDHSYMRPLVMDFAADRNTWDNGRQFMFGPSILVCPVLEPMYTSEDFFGKNPVKASEADIDWMAPRTCKVYLPASTEWYDFHTGERLPGGVSVEAPVNIATMPLYVRAGSIIPWGRDLQYANEKPWDDMTLRVYPGADADFTLYEDAGDGYGYELGEYTEIPVRWDERRRTLTIGRRQGAYPGMLAERTFRVALPDGTSKAVAYTGKAVKVKL